MRYPQAHWFTALPLTASLALGACSQESAPSAGIQTETSEPCHTNDLVIHNTRIHTVDDQQPIAEAVAVRDGRIIWTGAQSDTAPWLCGAAQALDMAGQTVYPGFTDSHQHLEGIGRRTRTLSLFGLPTLAATIAEIEAWAAEVAPGDWVLGRGWIEREWSDQQRFLTRHDVDPFTRDKPLYMPRADGVSALVNTRALALAGVTRDTPDPEGGRFERDGDGELTGYVLANAMQRFTRILPPETDDYLTENLLRGMQANVALGWTQTHDAGMSYRQVDLLQKLYAQGRMAHRIYAAVPLTESAELQRRGHLDSGDGWLTVRSIKVFIDGTLGSRGAALIDNYADADHNGFMNRTTREELMPVLESALQHGFQVMTHVIGDRAVRTLLDWYEEAQQTLSPEQWASRDLRWRMEHAQIIPPEDQARFVALKVLPSMQPSHGIGDLNFAPARLGPDRLAYAYPWQSLVDRGLMILGGSDAPVEVGDPRIEFYAAITRQRLDGSDDAGWHPELAVTRDTALKMLTLWPAYGAFQEQDRGSISVGKYADFTIFDTDFMTAEPGAILKAQPIMTIVGGQITYQR